MSRKSRFTPVELVVVLAVLSALMLPALQRAREASCQSDCKGNLHQIGKALRTYADENDGRFPTGPAMVGNVPLTDADFHTAKGRAGGFEILRTNGYLEDYAVYVCPSTDVASGKGRESLSWSNAGSGSGRANCSYAYRPGLIDEKSSAGFAISADLTGDKGVDSNGGQANHTKYGNILFVDGHVKGCIGLGWFSPGNTGLSDRDPDSKGAMVPNTLRDPRTGEAL